MFRPPQAAAADPALADDWPKRRKTVSLTNARWKIDIGGRAYDRLGDWTKSDDPEIRFFSGTAIYRANFTLPPVEGDRTLFLGRVAGGLAEVRLNGVDCGVAWCFPYRVRVPAAAQREGNNVLEVRVVNTWRNRLIGDCLLPPEQRHTQGCLAYKPGPHNNAEGFWGFSKLANGYSANDELVPCGLYGPVEMH